MFVIHKNTSDLEILYMEYDNKAYPININNHVVNLYDEKYIKKTNNDLLPFEYIFNDLATMTFNYLYTHEDEDEDEDDGAIGILLGEIEKLKARLDIEYKEFMKRQEYYDYLDKLIFLRDELLNRQELIKYKSNLNSIINGKSR